jgi:hypothetical protein
MATMTPEESVRSMAARLSAITWERRGDKAWSKAVLLKEYFRRAAQWADRHACDSRVPFFDIAACVNPDARAAKHVIDEVLATVAAGGGGWNAKQVTPFILHWAALNAEDRQTLPDPFEPLILLFERGGTFHTEHGEVNLEWKSVRMAGWRKRANDPPAADLTPEALDAIDRSGSIAQFGRVVGPLD